ncbi:MAG: thioester reductase domain-containing protein [Nitrososphaerota archaeon]|jgi:thioester reductase-like protein|nr:thioester reductase domain-containing protein [Nitrososphaerota archaeon]
MESILEYLALGVANYPDRCVFNFLDCSQEPFGMQKISMKQLYDKSCDMAWTLKKKGAKKGDRAIIFSMQDAGTIYAILGCMMEGVVFTVIPPPIDEAKLSRFISALNSCKPKFLISNYTLEQESKRNITKTLLKKAFLRVITLKRIYTDKLAKHEKYTPIRTYHKDDLVYLQYTSGSTSEPKGVMVTNGNLMGCIDSCREIIDFLDGYNLVSWVPFYHNIGLIVTIFIPLIVNTGTAYFIPTLQFLQKPALWIKTVSDFKVNATVAPNSAYEACTKLISKQDAKQYDLSHVDLLVNGSEFVYSQTIEKFCDLFDIPQKSFAAGYGLSECVCVATISHFCYKYQKIDIDQYLAGRFITTENTPHKLVVSLGRPLNNLKVLAVKDNGSLCAENEIGEIYIQGNNVCQGYWKNPSETKRFQATINGVEGFFYRTGDMGLIFEGDLYLTGRLTEMIIVNGKNIFPNDVSLLIHQQCPTLQKDAISIFSIQTENREEPILCIESDECAFASIVRDINRTVAQSYNFSFSNIVFVRKNTFPRTDNRKIRINAIKQFYEQNKLEVLYSTKTAPNNDNSMFDELTTPLSAKASIDEIKTCVRSVFKKFVAPVEFDDTTLFTDLGTNSLTVVEMLSKLERQSGIEIDIRQITSALNVNDLSLHIQLSLRGEKQTSLNLAAECILADDIRPQQNYTLQPNQCHNILLTGSTGFLGAYLIRSLIKQTNGNITLYCHVRAENQQSAMERIIKNMQFFQCWEETFQTNIIAIPGDLKKPHLGIEDNLYAKLCTTIDAIYHNGAVLNFLFPYTQLKRTNVVGTIECLRFACTGTPKYFHYVSSYSVYDNPSHFDKIGLESDPFLSSEGYFLGYSETKWVAEKLVTEAATRGLKTTLYRPGEITASIKENIWKLEDMISRTIVGCIQMHAAPDIDISLPLTPVDYVSDAITHISRQTNAIGKCFNLTNKTPINFKTICQFTKNAGYTLDILPYDEWIQKLAACSFEENALSILSRLFIDKRKDGEGLTERYGSKQAHIDTTNTDTLLENSEIKCLTIDEKAFHNYLTLFSKMGYIPTPLIPTPNPPTETPHEDTPKNKTNQPPSTKKPKKISSKASSKSASSKVSSKSGSSKSKSGSSKASDKTGSENPP